MIFYRLFVLYAVVLILPVDLVNAQSSSFRKIQFTSFGASLKTAYFIGDIPSEPTMMRPGIGLSVSRKFSPKFSFNAEISWERLMGSDKVFGELTNPYTNSYYLRNLHFRNDIQELNLCLQYDLFPLFDYYRKRPVLNFYAIAGLGFFYNNPKAKTSKGWVSLQPLETEGKKYYISQPSIPLGIGLRYKLSVQWDLELEFSYRVTFSDYLDDVSGDYVSPEKISKDGGLLANRSAEEKDFFTGDSRDLAYIEGKLGKSIITNGDYKYLDGFGPGNRRGSKNGPDSFVVFTVRIMYIIPTLVNCPDLRN